MKFFDCTRSRRRSHRTVRTTRPHPETQRSFIRARRVHDANPFNTEVESYEGTDRPPVHDWAIAH